MTKRTAKRLITWDEFETEFKPKQNTLTKRDEYKGWLYENYGEDDAFIRKFAQESPLNVWTIIDSDEGIILVSGWPTVDPLGYIITEVSCKESESIKVQDEEDIEYNLDFDGIAKKFTEKELALVLREGGFQNDFETKSEMVEFLIEISIQAIKSDEEAVKHIKVLLTE